MREAGSGVTRIAAAPWEPDECNFCAAHSPFLTRRSLAWKATHTRCILYRRLKHLIFQTVFLFSLYTSYNRFARYKLHVLFWGSEVTFAYGPGRVEKLLKLILESEYIT